MDQRPNVSLNDPAKPSKLLALVALVVAFSLPFILVKSFPHKDKSPIIHEQEPLITAPKIITLEKPSIDRQDSVTVAEASSLKSSKTIALKIAQKKIPTVKSPPVIPNTIKTATAKTPLIDDWTIIKTRNRDSLASVFNRTGLSAQTLRTILRDNPHSAALSKLKPNEELQLLIKDKTLEKMIVPYTTTQYLLIYRNGDHYKSTVNTRKMSTRSDYLTATVQGSLYGTAKRYNVPSKLIRQMTEIFTWDIDFAKDVRAGDQFTIVYKAFYIENKLVEIGDILAVSYNNRGKLFQAVRHTSNGGHSDYYTPEGTSLKKAFNRYPVRFSHISSTFSLSRYHPILHYRRAHKGVDLAARIGTPIQATGDGRIEIIGRQNAYGNMIKINHNKTYSTVYGHMLKFQKGLSRGDFVKRGQVIGYVGQTGLASGPHCHYEFHINKQPKNPSTMNLPRGESIYGRELARFKANSGTVLAQLKLFERARLASGNKKTTKKHA